MDLRKACLTCKTHFLTKDKRQKYCSFKCVYDKSSERNSIIRNQKIGMKFSDDYKKKMSERCKGINTWRKGQKMPESFGIFMSKFQKGKKYRLGIKESAEVRKKEAY